MITFLRQVFGTYTPITYSQNGVDVIPDGLAGVNFEYVAAITIFIVFMFCIMKIIGGLLKSDYKYR